MTLWKCGAHTLEVGKKTLVMGIVNATPDSFAGDGQLGKNVIGLAQQMMDDGADIIDIGGESTRPGAEQITADEELERILPVLDVLSRQSVIPLSVDTTKAEVARAALEHGASIINDISGGTFDAEMLPLVAAKNCGYVLMHLRGTPQTMQWSQQSGGATTDVIAEILAFWKTQIEKAVQCGVQKNQIALDPGFGFGKSLRENLETLRRGKDLQALGLPLLCAVSRKSTIGKILDNAPPQERLWGTASCVAIAINNGYGMIRVHDVPEMKQVARMADAINKSIF